MSVERIAGRYAKSLLDLSTEMGRTDAVLSDMKGLEEACKNRDLYLLLKSPIVSPQRKEKVLRALFSGKVDDMTLKFLMIILRKGREAYVPDIAKSFSRQYKDKNHITSVSLTTAVPIDDEAMKRIHQSLMESSATDKNLELESRVDEDIIGGFIIKIGDRHYDASVKGKLEKLRKSFSSNDYEKAM